MVSVMARPCSFAAARILRRPRGDGIVTGGHIVYEELHKRGDVVVLSGRERSQRIAEHRTCVCCIEHDRFWCRAGRRGNDFAVGDRPRGAVHEVPRVAARRSGGVCPDLFRQLLCFAIPAHVGIRDVVRLAGRRNCGARRVANLHLAADTHTREPRRPHHWPAVEARSELGINDQHTRPALFPTCIAAGVAGQQLDGHGRRLQGAGRSLDRCCRRWNRLQRWIGFARWRCRAAAEHAEPQCDSKRDPKPGRPAGSRDRCKPGHARSPSCNACDFRSHRRTSRRPVNVPMVTHQRAWRVRGHLRQRAGMSLDSAN